MPIYSHSKDYLEARSLRRKIVFYQVLLAVGVAFVFFANYVLITCYI